MHGQDWGSVSPDDTPVNCLKGQALLWAKKSLEMNLDDADLADEDTFNRVLWHAAHGERKPYPDQFAGSSRK